MTPSDCSRVPVDQPFAESLGDLSFRSNAFPAPRPFTCLFSKHLSVDAVTRTRRHACISLQGCIQGALTLHTSHGVFSLDAGSFCLLASEVDHHWQNTTNHSGATLGLLIDVAEPGHWPAQTGVIECARRLSQAVKSVHVLHAAEDENLHFAFWQVATCFTSIEPRESTAIVGALLALLAHCTTKLEGQRGSPSRRSDIASQIHRLLMTRIHDRLTIAQITQELKISPTHAKDAFRRAYGSGIIAYHNQLRISHAKRLLADTSLTVEQVSRKLGFSSHSYFSRVFDQHTGMAPTEFRARRPDPA